MSAFSIAVDLDGVLADYAQGFRNDHPDIHLDPALNRSSHLLPGSGSEQKRRNYELIKGTDFYARLPLMPGATKLFLEVLKHDPDPIILTAAPRFGATEDDFHVNPYWLGAAFHKRNWVETVLLHEVAYAQAVDLYDVVSLGRIDRIRIADDRFICTISSRKWHYMHRKHSEHQILIDDRSDNIDAWVENGGTGILFKDSESAIAELREITARA